MSTRLWCGWRNIPWGRGARRKLLGLGMVGLSLGLGKGDHLDYGCLRLGLEMSPNLGRT